MMEMLEKRKDLLGAVIKKRGVDNQFDVAIEEMSELTKAICKYRRYYRKYGVGSIGALLSIKEECADVCIMMAQIRLMVGGEEVDRVINEKLDRLAQRIGYKEDKK